MNIVLIIAAAAAFAAAVIGAKKKINVLAICGTVATLGLCGYIAYDSLIGNTNSQAQKTAMNLYTAEAYGMAQVVKEASGGKKVIVLGYGPAEMQSSFINALKSYGVSDIEYNAVMPNVPMGVPVERRIDAFVKAFDSYPTAALFIIKAESLMPEAARPLLGTGKKIVQCGPVVDKALWKSGIVVAHVKPKGAVVPEKLPSNPEKAFEMAFELVKK